MTDHLIGNPCLELVARGDDPSVKRARQCLIEMARRAKTNGHPPGHVGLEVIDSPLPWAGVVSPDRGLGRTNIFLTRGLVDRLSTEEIIAVIGHEWAHVILKSSLPEWAVRIAAILGSLGVHAIVLGFAWEGAWSAGGGGLLVLAATAAAMFLCLQWEAAALRAQELTCDRFAASLVGPKTMVATLRRVERLMASFPPAREKPNAWRWRSPTHPSVGTRIRHIARHRHRLPLRLG